ncbi:unnamed protein product [Parnassius apollo]|uniref:phytanoyl-CoA dioxygenase n=1 Tax=Parnassius apollo TaxID=110799 RepID=A0A8S3X1Y0_PARAO|nr:unnamed protein product [Parnassius apollo]
MEIIKSVKYLTINPKNVNVETSPSYILSKEQLNFYQENGFLIINGLIDFESLYNFKKRFIHIAKGVVDKGQITIVSEPALVAMGATGEDVINKLQNIENDDIFSTYIEDPRLLDVVSQLIDSDSVVAFHSMLINKPPGTGRHPPHQDLYYLPIRPADKIVAAWTAIDDVNKENGCLFVIPKSHKKHSLVAHSKTSGSNKLYYGIMDESLAPEAECVNLVMSTGDTVLFHPLLLHGSGPNISKNYRKAITCHYASGQCHYVPVEGTVQEPVAREIEAEARKKNFHIDFVDFWRYKNRLVRGVKSNL